MADAQSMALLLAEGESAKAKSLHDWLDARANDAHPLMLPYGCGLKYIDAGVVA